MQQASIGSPSCSIWHFLKLQPNSGHALEARPKGNLHCAVTFLHCIALLVFLNILQHIPDTGTACITIVQQCHVTGFGVELLLLEVFLNAFNHCVTTSMDAEVIDASFKVWDVRLNDWQFGCQFAHCSQKIGQSS
jgi:hypothetical protein